MWLIIAFFITLFTICILKDTHVKEYYNGYSRTTPGNEYDLSIPIWAALTIALLSIIPIANIALFGTFIVYYALCAYRGQSKHTSMIMFSLKGGNFITRFLLNIKKLLNKKI